MDYFFKIPLLLIFNFSFFTWFAKRTLVPRAGLEPAHREVRDFKSLVSTISPSGHANTISDFSFSQDVSFSTEPTFKTLLEKWTKIIFIV